MTSSDTPDPPPPAAAVGDPLDCRGQRCPLPIIALARTVPTVPVGSVVVLLADDPAATPDVAAWCRLTGHEQLPTPGPHTFLIRRAH